MTVKTGSIKKTMLFIALVLLYTPTAPAEESPEHMPEPAWMEVDAPHYSPEGLQDPFVPFIMPEDPPEALPAMERLRPLTPLERVELGQLNLAGIMHYPGQETMAVVELPDGKGFMLHKGTRIGPNQGEVVEIHPDRVVVREYVQGAYGFEERFSTLKLRPGEND